MLELNLAIDTSLQTPHLVFFTQEVCKEHRTNANLLILFPLFICLFFKTVFCVALAVLELTLFADQTGLKLTISTCLCLPSAEIKAVHHHVWFKLAHSFSGLK